MTDGEIYFRLNALFRDIIGEVDIVLHPETTAEDINGWDSVTHVSLMVAIETEFHVTFRNDEMEELKNVGEMAHLIQRHLK